MAPAKRALHHSANFERTLLRLEAFLDDPDRFDGLLDALERRCANLERLPGLGRPFTVGDDDGALSRAAYDVFMAAHPGVELRELVLDEHVLLYAVTRDAIIVLGLRHQREAGYERSGD